jgi:UDP-glucuronate 4-epimerase
MRRDFTYIDDLVEAVVRLLGKIPMGAPVDACDSLSPVAPWRVVNIGGGQPVQLLDFVDAIEAALGKPAIRNLLPMQAGDVPQTFADSHLLDALTGYRPSTPVAEGVAAFCAWWRERYGAA